MDTERVACSLSFFTMAKEKPSAEEIEEKRRQRAEKKEREAQKREAGEVQDASTSDGKPLFAPRQWANVKAGEENTLNGRMSHNVRIISWNILAQGLVRRKVFPGSDCLKWKEREPGLCAEMMYYDWDIAAFQEVDKVEVHGPTLEKSGRRYVYAKGYSIKQHGLLISWRVKAGVKASGLAFQEKEAGSKVIYFDQECVGDKREGEGRRGISRVTRNIALLVALANADDSSKGIIVATTHLFWHPLHAYERVRQTGILKRRLDDWKEENSAWKDWPVILAGDFNDQPHSATYKLMVGEALTQHNWEEIQRSSFVHSSVDEAREKENRAIAEGVAGEDEAGEEEEGYEGEEEEEGEGEGDAEGEEDDDPMPKNCRHALPEDGLLSLRELIQLHDLSSPLPSRKSGDDDGDGKELIGHQAETGLISAYGRYYGALEKVQDGNYFGSSNRGRERADDLSWTVDTPNPHLGPSKE